MKYFFDRPTVLLVILALSLTYLTGCDDIRVREGAKGEKTIMEFRVEGQPLDCIHSGQGISCNWEKYNRLQR